MADKFGQFFKDTLKEILVEHVKELKNQSEIDKFYEKYEKADFSGIYLEMINDTSNQMVRDAKMIMHENTLLFRGEETEIIARIEQKWSNAFATSETMYMMVLESVKDYSDGKLDFFLISSKLIYLFLGLNSPQALAHS